LKVARLEAKTSNNPYPRHETYGNIQHPRETGDLARGRSGNWV
jgi:hypothetical protein